jgi:hypothetical protein
MTWPNVGDIAGELTRIAATKKPERGQQSLQVWMQVLDDGAVRYHLGSSARHENDEGYWGSVTVPVNRSFSARNAAASLLNDAQRAYDEAGSGKMSAHAADRRTSRSIERARDIARPRRHEEVDDLVLVTLEDGDPARSSKALASVSAPGGTTWFAVVESAQIPALLEESGAIRTDETLWDGKPFGDASGAIRVVDGEIVGDGVFRERTGVKVAEVAQDPEMRRFLELLRRDWLGVQYSNRTRTGRARAGGVAFVFHEKSNESGIVVDEVSLRFSGSADTVLAAINGIVEILRTTGL